MFLFLNLIKKIIKIENFAIWLKKEFRIFKIGPKCPLYFDSDINICGWLEHNYNDVKYRHALSAISYRSYYEKNKKKLFYFYLTGFAMEVISETMGLIFFNIYSK
jgi:hypothetical protein